MIAASAALGIVVCLAHTAVAQRLGPVSALRPIGEHNQVTSFDDADISLAPPNSLSPIFEQSNNLNIDFSLQAFDLSSDLLTDAEFREFERLVSGDRWRRLTEEQAQVGQVAYWRESAARSSDGFSAMEQPRVESFPEITAEAQPPVSAVPERLEATVQSRQVDVPEKSSSTSVTASKLGTAAANSLPVTALGSMMQPQLPEGGAVDVPISQQEVGQLNEQIQIQQQAAENESGEEQTRHLGLLENARKSLAQANKYLLRDLKQQNRSNNFEQERERLIGQLEQEREQQQPAKGASAEELFNQLEQLRAELAQRNERLREINKSELLQKKRMEKIPGERTKANSDLADISQQVKDQENGEDNIYALVMLRAQELELEYKIKALSSESKLHEFENRLLPMRGDELAREIKLLELEIEAWNFAANEQRRKDIAEEVRLATLKAIEAAPALKTLANTNAQLIQQRAEFAKKIRLASDEDLEVQSELNVVKNHHETAEKSIVGSTYHEANGILMVDIRRQLPTPFRSRSRIREIESELREINLEQLELNESRRPLAHPFEYVEAKLAGVVSDATSSDEMKKMALDFVEGIRQQYDELGNAYHEYSELLRKIVAERKELVSEIESTRKFVDEQTLWIQSAKSIGFDHLVKAQHGARKFFAPAQWYGLLGCLGDRSCRRPHESVVGLMGLVGLFVFSRRFKG